MLSITLVAIGGALGSVARYLMILGIANFYPSYFPFGTLAVNILGSFFIGLVSGLTNSKTWQEFLMVGVIGGFTTFSAYSFQTCKLAEGGRVGAASLYTILSVVCCLLATFGGQASARAFVPVPPSE
jgi:CrcB protein